MNVYFEPYGVANTAGNRRIYSALRKHMPVGVYESSYNTADMIIYYVCGRHDQLERAISELHGRKYVIIQIALQSTRNPNPKDWMSIWNNAKLVWSYYKLPLDDYYHAPLAADPEIFHLVHGVDRNILVLTNGSTIDNESLSEVHEAANSVGGIAEHVSGVSDFELCIKYNSANFVSALRRKDGFEMPAIEGLLCGARPIMYDTPNYRQWFDSLAEFIPETDPLSVIEELKLLFKKPFRSVSLTESLEVLKKFDWGNITREFWSRIV